MWVFKKILKDKHKQAVATLHWFEELFFSSSSTKIVLFSEGQGIETGDRESCGLERVSLLDSSAAPGHSSFKLRLYSQQSLQDKFFKLG